ncbi:glycosyltransferase family 2 protein [Pseudosulfitobacter sp. DSM 107133]|uniref:glycosyltransferase family 2 protein n=1 Tax=Pseudosulfitobacter sp. DSM 107133 TaxID=2883100 RepID=UPI000DF3B047|nr:glycosyltransferase family 2 protein [Pseudosulfitobacter sp. DSM 107133]UOA26543.1 Beta-monoglucosyldiacylglycerol synthase [Pseudosulfitobacter sp. DSM 107133]
MSDPRLRLLKPEGVCDLRPTAPLGRQLVNNNLISRQDLLNALGLQRRVDAQLGDILVAEGVLRRTDLLSTLAKQHNVQMIDLRATPPRRNVASALPTAMCLRHHVVPWIWAGDTLLVATARPDLFHNLQRCMGTRGPAMMPVVADPAAILEQINRLFSAELAHKAITRVASIESCRNWGAGSNARALWLWSAGFALTACLLLAPTWTVTLACLWAVLTLVLTTAMKGAALIMQLIGGLHDHLTAPPPVPPPFRLPRVSVMVPLLHEKEIANALIKRMERLTYPKSLLEVVLVLEARDTVTRETIARTELPPWMSVIEVPDAQCLTTKPRALNYALDFCKGSIIGVWDAEDAPEPDQIEKVVLRFQQAPPDVACLQGILDYYNPRTNWMSRCFTIEYATWWRLVLPGIARLGLVIPLGGTTLFFRRDILEDLGGWDAHNVTEDADLGVRLARHGYRTELLPTVTHEEANCRPWRWVRQRSRWLKGFMITYFVHMRHPRQLLRELGWKRVMGLQVIFLATFTQFAAAPFLWSFWLIPLGLPHPVHLTLGPQVVWAMTVVFVISELLNLTLGLAAVSGRPHRHLLMWVPTMPFYFPLGALAAYKALHEMIAQPFFWDKTQHGYAEATEDV